MWVPNRGRFTGSWFTVLSGYSLNFEYGIAHEDGKSFSLTGDYFFLIKVEIAFHSPGRASFPALPNQGK
jgi:hypothetical protein